MKHKPKGWKGCCMLCAAWFRGEDKRRTKLSELRAVGGRRGQKHKPWKRVQADRVKRERLP